MRTGYAIAVLLAIPVYLPRLLRSFWVDEAGTFWIAHDGIVAAFDRCSHYAGQSILYGMVASLFCLEDGPLREPLLRVPSLIGFAVALYFTARLAERVIGRGAGVCAVLFTLFHNQSIDLFVQARAYSLAAAALAASCCLLVEWVEDRQPRQAAWYAVATALIFYFHYIYALVLLAQGVYLLWVAGVEKRTAGWKQLAAAWGGVLVLIAPLAGHVLLLARESGTLAAPAKPTFLVFAAEYAPWPLLLGLCGASALVMAGGGILGRARRQWLPAGGSVWLLLLVWGGVTAVVLFTVTVATGKELFVTRYVAQSAFAAALILTGAGFTIFRPHVALRWAFLGVLISTGSPLNWIGAWQPGYTEALPAVNIIRDILPGEPPPLLMQSTLLESNSMDWRKGPAGSHMFHELIAYPVPNRVYPLPIKVDFPEARYTEGLLDGELRDAPVILYLRFGDVPAWLIERMAARGYRLETVRPNAYVVGIFRRNPVP